MKKLTIRKMIIVAVTSFCTIMTGCSKQPIEDLKYILSDNNGSSESVSKPDSGTNTQTGTNTQAVEKETVPVESGEARESHELGDVTDTLVSNLGGHFAFDQLSNEDKELYSKILDILLVAESDITVPSLDTNQIDYVFNCVLLDHPELFYVTGYSFVKYSVNGTLSSIDFSGTYSMDVDEINRLRNFIDLEVKEIMGNAPAYGSDYDFAKYFYETIIFNTDYQLNAENNQNICSVFFSHESVCQGYAKSLQLLLQMEGIESVLVTGKVSGGEGHAWIIAKLDGSYYHIDPTWGDASYNAEDVEEIANLPEINYDYLAVTTEAISKSHVIDEIIILPKCTSLEDNYYVKEGLYFTGVDEGELHTAFDTAYANKETFLTLKCSDSTVYAELSTYLLDSEDAHIFEYLEGNMKQVVYSMNEGQNSISIWLE